MARRSRPVLVTFDLSDLERGVTEHLEVRLSRHPSETSGRVALRALAYALLWEPGIAFGPGLCVPEAPALWVREGRGRARLWVEVGAPGLGRLERAVRRAERVAVITDRPLRDLRQVWGRRMSPRVRSVEVWRVDPGAVAAVETRLGSREPCTLVVAGDTITLGWAGEAGIHGLIRDRLGHLC